MKKLTNYIDEFKEKLNLDSDYAVAKNLGIARQQMTRIRNGQVAIGRAKCVRIANALKIDPIEIVATIEASKEKNPEVKNMWIRLAKEKQKDEKTK